MVELGERGVVAALEVGLALLATCVVPDEDDDIDAADVEEVEEDALVAPGTTGKGGMMLAEGRRSFEGTAELLTPRRMAYLAVR